MFKDSVGSKGDLGIEVGPLRYKNSGSKILIRETKLPGFQTSFLLSTLSTDAILRGHPGPLSQLVKGGAEGVASPM